MKRWVCVTVFVTFLLVCTGQVFARSVYSDWSMLYIQDAEGAYRILPESLKNTDYTQDVTREEFGELIYEMMGYMSGYIAYYKAFEEAEEEGTDFDVTTGPGRVYPQAAPPDISFSDTTNQKLIDLYNLGILKGKGDKSFDPEASLTREEAATILERVCDYYSLQEFPNNTVFQDAEQISQWAKEGVDIICGMGIMNGMGDGTFSPGTYYTREQAVASAVRTMESIPYLCVRQQVFPGEFFVFNSMWMWMEDENQELVWMAPRIWRTYSYRMEHGYSGAEFFEWGTERIAAAYGSSPEPSSISYGYWGTTFLDLSTGEEKLFLPEDAGTFYGLSADQNYIIMEKILYSEANVDSAYSVYCVYDLEGNACTAPESSWEELYRAGFVDTEYAYQYQWKQ